MDALDIQAWIEELTLTREAARNEALNWQAENKALKYTIARLEGEIANLHASESPFQQSAADTAVKLREMLAAKDAEIARLTALLAPTTTYDHMADSFRYAVDLGKLQQPAQEQADEHPAKKGWVELLGTRVCNWSPSERVSTLEETWVLAKDWWYGQKPEVIAAYDRYMAQQLDPVQEHPAKNGWVDTFIREEWKWAPKLLNERDWNRAANLWDEWQPQIIAAYDRYIARQEGGQAQ